MKEVDLQKKIDYFNFVWVQFDFGVDCDLRRNIYSPAQFICRKAKYVIILVYKKKIKNPSIRFEPKAFNLINFKKSQMYNQEIKCSESLKLHIHSN